MLHSSYNLNRLGSPTAGDLINNSAFDAVGGSANYFGTSPPFNVYDTNLSSSMCPLGMSAQPRRRYSIGGLPSASMTEYLGLMQQNAEAAHLSNLLNETKTSITRSSQILSRGEDLSGDILLSAAAGDVIADMATRYYDTRDIDITGANILNQMPINYSSQPNICYAQPNYTNSHMPMHTDLYLSRYKNLPSGSTTTAPIASSLNYHSRQLPSQPLPHQTFYNSFVSAYTNPYCNPLSYNTTVGGGSGGAITNTLPYNYRQSYNQSYSSNKYNQPPPPYSSVLSSTQPQSHYHQYHRPLHYTSNPAISQSSNYYFKHPVQSHFQSNKLASSALANTSNSAQYLQHKNQHSGYSNQHFDLHHLNSNNCYSKLDLLDYTKQGEHTKRQVSFNIDVDTLSITS